jgi:hypothetical protein
LFLKIKGVMSLGFLTENKDDAIIWRGPRKNGLIRQFLTDVDWSDIDRIFNELIVDALTALEGTGCPPSSVSFQFGADKGLTQNTDSLTVKGIISIPLPE